MSGSSASAAPATASAAPKDINSVLANKGLKFHIKTGGTKYECQVHTDRASYERVRSSRSSSADSISSSSNRSQ